LKSKGKHIFLLENTPITVLATHALAKDSILKIASCECIANEPGLPPYAVWISREEDLHDFVYQIPDLAWDMMEYAEEPLEILYPQRKYVSPLQEAAQEPISIRLVRGKKLETFVRQHGPLLTFPVQIIETQPACVDEQHDLREKEQTHKRVKSMKLFSDGSFTFVR